MNYKNGRVFPPYKSKVPKAKSISGLALKDLLKLRRSHDAYLLKQQVYQTELIEREAINIANEIKNSEIVNAEADWVLRHLTPVYDLQKKMIEVLAPWKVGVLGGMVFDFIEYKKQRYRLPHAEGLIKNAAQLDSVINEILAKKPDFTRIPKRPWPRMPSRETNLTIGGAKVKFALDLIDRQELDQLIIQAESRKMEGELKIYELQARLASTEKEVRKQAQKFRRDLQKQLQVLSGCPYCNGNLNDGNAHLDHIYPVSKGGKSTDKNLVFVCVQCNQDKSDLTLRAFLVKYSKDQQTIYSHLELLKKDF